MGAIKTHALKIKPDSFKDILSGKLNFKIVKNDRDYEEGDILQLEEFDNKGYTGRYVNAEVTYILDAELTYKLNDAEYKEGYVVLGIKIRLDRGAVIL